MIRIYNIYIYAAEITGKVDAKWGPRVRNDGECREIYSANSTLVTNLRHLNVYLHSKSRYQGFPHHLSSFMRWYGCVYSTLSNLKCLEKKTLQGAELEVNTEGLQKKKGVLLISSKIPARNRHVGVHFLKLNRISFELGKCGQSSPQCEK